MFFFILFIKRNLGLAMRNLFKIAKRSLHTTSLCFRGPLKFPGWYPRDHKPGPFPNTEKERRASAIKYGLRPEDYKTISKDNVQNYCGDYPDLGVVTFDHKDPYEDYSNRMFRRNWGEPVAKDFIYYRPDRLTFTGLEIQDYTWKRAVYLFFQVCTPMFLLFWYLRNATSDSFRWKNPVMPKQYPYDFNRAWPLEDPRNYPIENYSFELTEPIEHVVDAVQNEQAAEKMTTADDELVQKTKQVDEAELIDKTESTTPIESEKIV